MDRKRIYENDQELYLSPSEVFLRDISKGLKRMADVLENKIE